MHNQYYVNRIYPQNFTITVWDFVWKVPSHYETNLCLSRVSRLVHQTKPFDPPEIPFSSLSLISDKVSENVDGLVKYTRDLWQKAANMFYGIGRKLEREGDRFGSQVERLVEKKVETLGTQAEAYSTHVQKKINETFQDIQQKSIGIVQEFNNQLTQSTGAIRKKTESFVETMAKTTQSQIASFWESLTKS